MLFQHLESRRLLAAASSLIAAPLEPAPAVAINATPDETKRSSKASAAPRDLRVRNLAIINADTGAVVPGYSTLVNGMTVDLGKLPTRFTILAQADRPAESIRFSTGDRATQFVDDIVSYSLNGSTDGKFNAWAAPRSGSVTLDVTPYANDGGRGGAGVPTTLTLNMRSPAPNPNLIPTPKPTGAPTTIPTTTPVTPGLPTIQLKTIQTTISAGHAFHAEASLTTVPGFQVEDATFAWDFGDPTGRFNKLPGFNAAHIYETPGSYTAKLTVTAPGGATATKTVAVEVVASNYTSIYVAANGSDTNAGTSQNQAVKTIAKAVALAGSNSEILLQRGDTFSMSSQVSIDGRNIFVGAFGNGASPVVMWTGARSASGMLSVGKAAVNVTIRDLTFDSTYTGDTGSSGMPQAIVAGGTATTVRNNTFLNIGYAINANQQPTGLLVQDNAVPLATGLRSYFVWGQGSDLVIVGNNAVNSTREHIVRLGGADRVNLSYNDFTNADRTRNGDASDNAKGAAVIQKGSFGYVGYNQLRGPIGVGPLGGPDGLAAAGSRFNHATIENNACFATTINVHYGASNVTIRGNTIHQNNFEAIKLEPYNTSFSRGAVDVVIDQNVAINTGSVGNFLWVLGPVDGITLTRNIYIAPTLKAGAYGTAAVYVNDTSLSSFRLIDGNVWPSSSRSTGYARGGIMFVGTDYSSLNHRTNDEWNAMPQVGTDEWKDVMLD